MPGGQLHIGWSQIEITPPKKTLLLGQFYARLANTAISPLTATALAVETRTPDDSLEQAIFLSCDLAAEDFKSDLRAKLAGRCLGFDINKLTINATHTHNAPPVRSGMYEEPADDPDFMTPDEYRGFLVNRLADVVESAWEERQPGQSVGASPTPSWGAVAAPPTAMGRRGCTERPTGRTSLALKPVTIMR